VAVYEKFYYRVSNRLALTVTLNSMNGTTHVHAIGTGRDSGLLKFDWGSSNHFANIVKDTLYEYKI